ncbi:Amino acid transporter [Mariniradius saccharolyticus AK6]|uniref:Amino acid transporter n=2 Tax=Mariniradius TaxID=1245590 RepID=M7XIT9_9BACT|nr:Amino acid transporter [Mariniradius saccharolyticus AK6]
MNFGFILNIASMALSRQMGLAGLVATGVCSMIGASIHVVPFMIQRHVPGIGPYVLWAFVFAALPAILAALAYASLATAMPRAGGSYLYASRGLHPYWGFVASFSQWFGLSIVIGVVAYVTVPFLRDVAAAMAWEQLAQALDLGWVRVLLALAFLWLFVWINIQGTKSYENAVLPMMFLMFALGAIVIVAGFSSSQEDFLAAYQERHGGSWTNDTTATFSWSTFFSAGAILFASFIGFDSIAQAGGEAKNPSKKLPLAIGLTILVVGAFYLLFTAAVYHAVPWAFVAEQAISADITAPGLMGYILPAGWTILILAGAAVALLNDLPAMLLSVSRLMFAWAEDGIFPKKISTIHPQYQSPVVALWASGLIGSIGILGSHFAGDFFLGIDIMVTSMMVNFLLICLTLAVIGQKNPALAKEIKFLNNPKPREFIGWTGVVVMLFFLGIHTAKDLQATREAWYFHSTWVWLAVMAIGSLIFFFQMQQMKKRGIDANKRFQRLPVENGKTQIN